MSLLKRLGLARSDSPPRSRFIRALRDELNGLPPERAELVAAFAGLLVRVAYADLEISEAELETMKAVIVANSGLSPAEAAAVATIAVRQATALGGIDYSALTAAFNDLASQAEKESLIDCLYAIATADDTVTVVEDEEIRQVSRALLLTHARFVAIRARYKEKLEVMRLLRETQRKRK